jgi:hypothetical protein
MMRYVVSTAILMTLAALLGAQDPRTGPSARQRAELLQRNYGVAERLVDGSLALAKTSSSLDRSTSYDEIIRTLEKEIKEAAQAGDAERVAELTDHLSRLMNEGLLPNLQKARQVISANSPDEKSLFDLRDLARRMTVEIADTVAHSTVADKPEVRAKLNDLRAAREQVEQKVEPKKQ